MKKLWFIFGSLLILFSFSSCIQSSQLNETAIVQAIGIDKTEDQFQVTLQIYTPKGAGANTAVDTSKNNSSIIRVEGETLAKAIRNATLSQGKRIFTGHNRVLVIGKEMAQSGVEHIFSYFNRNALTRQNVTVLVAENTAEEIVTTSIEQGILAAETIKKTVDNTVQNGYIFPCPYYLLAKNMNLYHGAVAVPVISVQAKDQEEPQQGNASGSGDAQQGETIPDISSIIIEKTALFHDYKMIGELTQTQTRGLLFLSDQIEKTILVAETENIGKCSLDIFRCHTKLEPVVQGDEITFLLKAEIKASLDEVLLPKGNSFSEEEIEKLEQYAVALLQQEMQDVFRVAVQENHCDLLYLGDLIRKENPDVWERIGSDFDERLQSVQLQTDIDFQIERVGLETDETED